jgi:hypothetical protein
MIVHEALAAEKESDVSDFLPMVTQASTLPQHQLCHLHEHIGSSATLHAAAGGSLF